MGGEYTALYPRTGSVVGLCRCGVSRTAMQLFVVVLNIFVFIYRSMCQHLNINKYG